MLLKSLWRWFRDRHQAPSPEMPPRGMTTSAAILGSQPSTAEASLRVEIAKAKFFSKPGETTRLCQWCAEFYKEAQPRSYTEIQLLHQRVIQTSPNIRDDVAICQSCYDKVTETPVRIDPYTSQLEPGVSNHGYPNIALRRSA